MIVKVRILRTGRDFLGRVWWWLILGGRYWDGWVLTWLVLDLRPCFVGWFSGYSCAQVVIFWSTFLVVHMGTKLHTLQSTFPTSHVPPLCTPSPTVVFNIILVPIIKGHWWEKSEVNVGTSYINQIFTIIYVYFALYNVLYNYWFNKILGRAQSHIIIYTIMESILFDFSLLKPNMLWKNYTTTTGNERKYWRNKILQLLDKGKKNKRFNLIYSHWE